MTANRQLNESGGRLKLFSSPDNCHVVLQTIPQLHILAESAIKCLDLMIRSTT